MKACCGASIVDRCMKSSTACAYCRPTKCALPQMTPEARGMVRVQSHCLADPLEPLPRSPSEPGEEFAHLDHDEVVVGVQLQRPILMIAGAIHVVSHDRDPRGEDAMDVGVVVVERHRPVELERDLVESRVLVLAPAIAPALTEYATAPRVGMSVVGIELQGPVDQLQRLGVVVARCGGAGPWRPARIHRRPCWTASGG